MICDIRLVVFLECKLDLSRVDEAVDELGRKKKAVTHSAVVYLQKIPVLISHRKYASG